MNHLYHFNLGGVMFGSSRTKIWKKMLTETPKTMTTSAMICDREKGLLYIIGHILWLEQPCQVYSLSIRQDEYCTFWLLYICGPHHCNTTSQPHKGTPGLGVSDQKVCAWWETWPLLHSKVHYSNSITVKKYLVKVTTSAVTAVSW